MKMFLVILLVLMVAYPLVTRFIMVENPMRAGAAPSYSCAQEGQMPDPGKNFYSCATLKTINEQYLAKIKPIFKQKCLMCHGVTKKLPLYSRIPPTSWLVQRDMLSAVQQVNMTWDFPFRGEEGRESQTGALKELREVVEENHMPPFQYMLMHWGSQLNSEEKDTILQWVRWARQELQRNPSLQP